MDNYLIWLCAVDYMIEKLGIQNEVGIEDVKRSTDAVYYGVQVE
jgi:hypothetical protein